MACSEERNFNCFDANDTAVTISDTCISLVEDGTDSISFEGCSLEKSTVLTLRQSPNASFSHGSTHKLDPAVAGQQSFYVASVINVTNPKFHSWGKGAGGLMGLAYPAFAEPTASAPSNTTAFQALLWNASGLLSSDRSEGGRHLVGLDFRASSDPQGSWLHLGGLDPEYAQPHHTPRSLPSTTATSDGNGNGNSNYSSGNENNGVGRGVRWSESGTTQKKGDDDGGGGVFHSLRVHHLSLCGVPLFASALRGVGDWPAILDTGSDCLTLPFELFEAFASWAPVVFCGKSSQGEAWNGGDGGSKNNDGDDQSEEAPLFPLSFMNSTGRHLCYVDTDQLAELPWLSFMLKGHQRTAGAVPPDTVVVTATTISPSMTSSSSSVGDGSDDDEDEEEWIHIPLRSLLMDPSFDVVLRGNEGYKDVDDTRQQQQQQQKQQQRRRLRPLCVERGSRALYSFKTDVDGDDKDDDKDDDDDGSGSSGGFSNGGEWLDDDFMGSGEPAPAPTAFAAPFTSPLPGIVFGSVALRALYAALDFDKMLVGLANKDAADMADDIAAAASITAASAGVEQPQQAEEGQDQQQQQQGRRRRRASPWLSGCPARAECAGEQTWDEASNQCERPQCRRYYYGTFDEKDGTRCAFDPGAVALGVILLIFCAGMELLNHVLRQHMGQQLGRAALPTPPPGARAPHKNTCPTLPLTRSTNSGGRGSNGNARRCNNQDQGVFEALANVTGVSALVDACVVVVLARMDRQIDEHVAREQEGRERQIAAERELEEALFGGVGGGGGGGGRDGGGGGVDGSAGVAGSGGGGRRSGFERYQFPARMRRFISEQARMSNPQQQQHQRHEGRTAAAAHVDATFADVGTPQRPQEGQVGVGLNEAGAALVIASASNGSGGPSVSVGDRVEVRDSGDEQWEVGTVVALVLGDRCDDEAVVGDDTEGALSLLPSVKLDEYEDAYAWDEWRIAPLVN